MAQIRYFKALMGAAPSRDKGLAAERSTFSKGGSAAKIAAATAYLEIGGPTYGLTILNRLGDAILGLPLASS